MKTKTINVYSIKELSQKAQEKAFNKWLENIDYSWGSDNEKTLEAFTNIFPVKVKNWEYGYRNYINFSMICDDEIEELKGLRLAAYIYNNYYLRLYKGKYYSKGKYIDGKYHYKHRYSKVIKDNSCVLTGYCIDDDILQPVYDFLKKPDKDINFYDLINNCLQSWLSACNKDYEYCTSMEYFTEEAESNDYEYLDTGSMF